MRKQRLVILQEGEILVETGHGDARPFIVETAKAACAHWARDFWSSARKKARA
jgi:ferric-dicitrate binding protein FerR (iron transport regulator)